MTIKGKVPCSVFGIFLIFLFFAAFIIPYMGIIEPLFYGLLLLFSVVLVAIPLMAFLYPGYFHATKQAAWKGFADSNKLYFDRGNFFRTSSVYGTYHGYDLKIDLYLNLVSLSNFKDLIDLDYSPYTRCELSGEKLTNSSHLVQQYNDEGDIINLFKSTPTLNGKFVAKQRQPGIHYEQRGVEVDDASLLLILQAMRNVADSYASLLPLEGEIVPLLQKTWLRIHESQQPIITQLLYDIGQTTMKSLSWQASRLLCPNCLTRFGVRQVHLSLSTIMYCGCRICGQSRKYLKVNTIAVLNHKMLSNQTQDNNILRVNWLTRRALFDFDGVEIINATDEDVERFVVQIGNDTDIFRQFRYRHMPCTVLNGAGLSENSMKILQTTFDNVVVK